MVHDELCKVITLVLLDIVAPIACRIVKEDIYMNRFSQNIETCTVITKIKVS